MAENTDKKFVSYKDAGVDVAEGARAVDLMKKVVQSTYTEGVMGSIGSFGGVFKLGEYKKPCLVSGTDGVGTKLKIAFDMDKHTTVGIDLVAMSVNDILCQGAKPLFFLDYIATGKVTAEKIAQIVEGVAEGCRLSGAALLGGETAEMQGFYADGEYDLAGFAVGVAEEEDLIDGSTVQSGDVLLGLPSSGVHSNGYSLVRRLFQPDEYGVVFPELEERLGDALLRPTRIYATAVSHFPKGTVKGLVHMTGGGFYENLPRAIPEQLGARVDTGSWERPAIFKLIERRGVQTDEMYRTFNMGIGMVALVSAVDLEAVESALKEAGEPFVKIGTVAPVKELKQEGLLDGERVLLV